MVRKTTFSLHETTVESYIIFRPILFFIICVLFAEIYIIHSFIHVVGCAGYVVWVAQAMWWIFVRIKLNSAQLSLSWSLG